jgi:hypothetical protein
MSRKARVLSDSKSLKQGISFLMILQKMHEAILFIGAVAGGSVGEMLPGGETMMQDVGGALVERLSQRLLASSTLSLLSLLSSTANLHDM